MSTQLTREDKVKEKAPFEKLYDDITQTSGSRFEASRRYKLHDTLSLWTVTILSTSLIFLALIHNFKLLTYNENWMGAIEIFLTVFLLVFSLLLAKNNYGVLSDRMHSSGMELNRLRRKIRPYKDSDSSLPEYDKFTNLYDRILSRTENHEQIDKRKYELRYPKKYFDWWGARMKAWIFISIMYILNLSAYIFAVAVVAASFYLLFRQPET